MSVGRFFSQHFTLFISCYTHDHIPFLYGICLIINASKSLSNYLTGKSTLSNIELYRDWITYFFLFCIAWACNQNVFNSYHELLIFSFFLPWHIKLAKRCIELIVWIALALILFTWSIEIADIKFFLTIQRQKWFDFSIKWQHSNA